MPNHLLLTSSLMDNNQSTHRALAYVAQLVGDCPANQKVASVIPTQGTCQDCRFGRWSGCMEEATDRCFFFHVDVSLPLFSLPFPLSRINKRKSHKEDKLDLQYCAVYMDSIIFMSLIYKMNCLSVPTLILSYIIKIPQMLYILLTLDIKNEMYKKVHIYFQV